MAKRLVEEARDDFRTLHYRYRTEVTYLNWIKRHNQFYGNRNAVELGPAVIQAFPS